MVQIHGAFLSKVCRNNTLVCDNNRPYLFTGVPNQEEQQHKPVGKHDTQATRYKRCKLVCQDMVGNQRLLASATHTHTHTHTHRQNTKGTTQLEPLPDE